MSKDDQTDAEIVAWELIQTIVTKAKAKQDYKKELGLLAHMARTDKEVRAVVDRLLDALRDNQEKQS